MAEDFNSKTSKVLVGTAVTAIESKLFAVELNISVRHAKRNAGLFVAFELADKTEVNSVSFQIDIILSIFFFNLQRKLA